MAIQQLFRQPLKHVVVTTFHEAGYQEYGKKCLNTFLEKWPADVELIVYAEDVDVKETAPNLTVLDHTAVLPKLIEFRNRYGSHPFANGFSPLGDGKFDFLWDTIRFTNKVFAVTDAIRRTKGVADQLIWLDADTITHSPVSSSFLDKLAPRETQLATYLNRKNYPECGWVGYNLNHEFIDEFARRFDEIYLSGEFLEIQESHDSYIFWKIVQDMEREGLATFYLIGDSTTVGHVFINSELGAYLDHLKGPRKTLGQSQARDLKIKRKESWWKKAG